MRNDPLMYDDGMDREPIRFFVPSYEGEIVQEFGHCLKCNFIAGDLVKPAWN